GRSDSGGCAGDENGRKLANHEVTPFDDDRHDCIHYHDHLYCQAARSSKRMRVTREQVAAHRTHILAAAARLFRLRGFDDVTVAEVMKDAGLTHGAFYGHFSSKEALIAEAVGQALAPAAGAAEARKSIAAYADGYLSPRHRDDRGSSCPFSCLGTEAARGSADLRRGMTQSVRREIDRFSAEAK